MKRIDSSNARPDVNGTGKKGFHDNADLAGQDATYLTPAFLNMVQEELCNIIEKNGKVLNPNSNQQLYEILATDSDLVALAALVEQRLQQLNQEMQDNDDELQTQLSDALESLQQQISNLANGLATLYPKVIMSGVIKAGQAWSIKRPTSSNISFLDTRYALQLTPEAGHEAWESWRNDDRIDFNIWNRSGTNRVGYSGNVSWSIIQTEGLTSSAGNGDYVYTGTPVVFPILPGESKSFLLIGGGGGGGSTRYEDLVAIPNPSALKGSDGEDSYLSIDGTTIKFTAGGGKGAVGGIDGGNGQFINGTAGEGGLWSIVGEYASATRTNGSSGNATGENHKGAKTDTSGRGAGGDGSDGYDVVTQGFGGGAGESARLSILYTNNTATTQYARLYVGKAGEGEKSRLITNEDGTVVTPEYYIVGKDGVNGFARVASAV